MLRGILEIPNFGKNLRGVQKKMWFKNKMVHQIHYVGAQIRWKYANICISESAKI